MIRERIKAAFRYSLQVLKIYSIRNVYFQYWQRISKRSPDAARKKITKSWTLPTRSWTLAM